MSRVAQLLVLLGVSQCEAEICNGAVTELSFSMTDGASITVNNFGNRQSLTDESPKEARIANAGEYDGKSIDVVLKSYEPDFTDPDCTDGGDTKGAAGKDGFTGNFDCAMKLKNASEGDGIANFYLGKHDFHPLWLLFEYSDGSGAATLPYVDLTLWDTGAMEYFKINKAAFESYACGITECKLNITDSQIEGNSTANGVAYYEALKFEATESGLDDVGDIWGPSDKAARNAVKFRIKASSGVVIELGRDMGGGGNIELSGASAINNGMECPAAVVVHGDPMFKVNGTGSHFWVEPNVLTPLLTWTSPAGKDMVLSGVTFETPDAANQWMKKLQVTEDGATVYEATVDTPLPTMSTVGGLHMSVDKSLANKFESAHLKKAHEHLNVHFDAGLIPNSKGIFAEMAGVHKMSEATAALMTRPNLKRSPVNALQP